MLKTHLSPRFGDKGLSEITRQEIQPSVVHLTQAGYAPGPAATFTMCGARESFRPGEWIAPLFETYQPVKEESDRKSKAWSKEFHRKQAKENFL